MKSNYKPIGEYIQLVDNRNRNLKVSTLLGLTVNKEFIPSVANTVGTDMGNYKIIKKNQFACSLMQVRRDKKIPVALLKDFDESIISQAYPVFEIIDEDEILPEYLMMWFSRSEFDREACFYAVGGVRGSLEWEDFCNMKLPVPHIEKQKAIVKEHNTIVNRIKLNEEINKKLEETAQAIYKQWFVEFEFPMSKENAVSIDKPELEGKAYKANGGEMVWNEMLGKDVPLGWKDGELGELLDLINGYAFKSDEFQEEGNLPIIKIKNIKPPLVTLLDVQYYNDKLIDQINRVTIDCGDILISMTGSGVNQMNSAVGQVGRYLHSNKALLNQRVCKLEPKKDIFSEFIYRIISDKDVHMTLLFGSTGSANQANISPFQIKSLDILIPKKYLLEKYEIICVSMKHRQIEQNIKLEELKDLLLSKMAK